MSDEEQYDIQLPRMTGPGRRPYNEPTIVDTWTAEALIEVLQDCGGDLELFLKRFYPAPDQQQLLLSRVLLKLMSAENAKQYQEWEKLLRCFRTAKLALAERDALSAISDMPKPHQDDKISDWLAYARFWASDKTAELKETAKSARANVAQVAPEPSPELRAVLGSLKDSAGEIERADRIAYKEDIKTPQKIIEMRQRPPDYYGD